MNRIGVFFKTYHWRVLLTQKSLSTREFQKSSKSHYWLLSIPIASFCLGTWQVRRLAWKKNLISELEIRSQTEAVPLPIDIMAPGKMKEMEYRRVIVHGEFDHSKEILLGPRSLNEGVHQMGGLGSRPTIGYHIVTPFLLDNGNRILVNRGWVPNDKRNASSRLEGQTRGPLQLTGYVRCDGKRPQFSPKVDDESLTWNYCDLDKFSKNLNTLPIMIDVDASLSVPGGPIGGQTRITLRNEHMQYIITWYSLSAATLFLYYQFRKKPRF